MTVKLSRRSLLQGVSLAAQQLGVSTATATRQMTTLRTLLHDPLFLRGHDGLVPTARMSELVPKLKVLQEGLIDVVRRPVKFDPADPRRRGRQRDLRLLDALPQRPLRRCDGPPSLLRSAHREFPEAPRLGPH